MSPFESCVKNLRNDNFVLTLNFFARFSIQFDGLYPRYSYLEKNLKSLVSMPLYPDKDVH